MARHRVSTVCRLFAILILSAVLVAELAVFANLASHSQYLSNWLNFISAAIYRSRTTISSSRYLEAATYLATHGRNSSQTLLYLRDVKPVAPLPSDINNSSIYWKFVYQINSAGLYLDTESTLSGKEASLVDQLVHHLAHGKIEKLRSEDMTGTEFKFTAYYEDGSRAIMKPMRYSRDKQVPKDRFYFSEQERHHAEIAAFHLDRLLGFNSVPPCAGRQMNITGEIRELADDQLLATVFQTPNGNWCFHGRCMYFCDIHHPFCGSPDAIEFSVCVMVPFGNWPAKPLMSPWRRSYSATNFAPWQLPKANDTYCENLRRNSSTYNDGKRLFQAIDLIVFDFLMGNQDRHHFEVFQQFNHSFVTFDNGRGFGRHSLDELWILTPIIQCCQMRKSTYDKLVYFDTQTSLSSLMRFSLSRDVLNANAPLLSDNHLRSLDRRVKILLSTVRDCAAKLGGLEQIFVYQ